MLISFEKESFSLCPKVVMRLSYISPDRSFSIERVSDLVINAMLLEIYFLEESIEVYEYYFKKEYEKAIELYSSSLMG